jgi:L-2-hydroxyglutarate oxidase
VDYKIVAQKLRDLLIAGGAEVRFFAAVRSIDERGDLAITTDRGVEHAKWLINCGGLNCDRIARSMGLTPDVRIIPFRGEYYFLQPSSHGLVRGLIYPVPDPALPFLGVHFTRTVYGQVEAGPNAVLAFSREGYTMRQVDWDHLADTLSFGGFWKMAARFWRTGVYEFYRSLSKAAFVRVLQELVPAITAADLTRGGAGVRAQAVDAQGQMVQDFHFLWTPRSLHVLNAPSPAATASLAIGQHIAQQALATFAHHPTQGLAS